MTAIQRSRDYGYGYRDPSIRVTAIPQADPAIAEESRHSSDRIAARSTAYLAEQGAPSDEDRARPGSSYVQSDLRVDALRA